MDFRILVKPIYLIKNIVVDALRKRCSLLTEMKIEVIGFDEIKELYDTDPDFSKMWRECRAPSLIEQPSKFDEYFIQEGIFFNVFSCAFLRVL